MPGPDGTPMPRSLLTEIAAYGRFPRMGSPYWREYGQGGVVSSTWTPMANRLRRELGRPVRILKVMGLRSDAGAGRKKRPLFRTVLADSAWIGDEWLPVKDEPTDAVKAIRIQGAGTGGVSTNRPHSPGTRTHLMGPTGEFQRRVLAESSKALRSKAGGLPRRSR